MAYERRDNATDLMQSASYVSMTQIGSIKVEDLDRVDSICSANPPPAKQFNGPKRIDPTRPLRRCREWTTETIGTLKDDGILLESV